MKILAAEGDTVAVGALLAEIAPTARRPDGRPLQRRAPADSASAPETAAPADGGPTAATQAGEVIEIVIPPMGESVTEGTLLEWHKSRSATRSPTTRRSSRSRPTRSTPSFPRPPAGTITELLVEAGDTVTVGQVIARMQRERRRLDRQPRRPRRAAGRRRPPPRRPPAAATPDGVKCLARRARASPPPRASTSPPSAAAARAVGSPRPTCWRPTDGGAARLPQPRGAEAQPISGAAAMLAKYMDESRAIPTATSFRTITVTAMDARRKQLKEAGQKVSFTHLIAYAIARAATESMPVMAHHFEERDGKPHRVDDGGVNLGIAVDVEKKDGSRTLMVPVIRDAGRMSFAEFLGAFDGLIDKARKNTLTADDLVGANISLTNPGGIGTIASVPRLMVGQGTIVATGSIAYPVGPRQHRRPASAPRRS